MAKDLKIRYTLQSGSLPNGLRLDPDTGQIIGNVGFDALGEGPVWVTPSGSLGTFAERAAFTKVTFQATTTKSPVVFNIVNGYIPWGLTFNPTTGELQGTIADLKLRINEAANTLDGPTWNTAFGRLANYDEGSTGSISLSVTPPSGRTIKTYSLVDSFLPFGLKLNPSTGVISGTVATLRNPGPYVDVPKLPVPVWNTPEGSLGVFEEYRTIATITPSVTPAAGRTILRYQIREGFLPFGLKMNLATGAITGTTAELRIADTPYINTANNPVVNDQIQITDVYGVVDNTKTFTALNGDTLGTFTKGTAIDRRRIRMTPGTGAGTDTSGRLVRGYIKSGFLPFGLQLSQAGNAVDISGTVLNNVRTRTGVYTFTIGFYDINDPMYRRNEVTRTYTITVN